MLNKKLIGGILFYFGFINIAYSNFDTDSKYSGAHGYMQTRGSLFSNGQNIPKPPGCNLQETMEQTNKCLERSEQIKKGLQQQLAYLNRSKDNTSRNLVTTLGSLLDWYSGERNQSFADLFNLQAVNFTDNGDGAKFTGYITSAINVQLTPSSRFKIPIYKKPVMGKLPVHAEIARGALAGRGLEIAWTDNPIALYFAQIQGSANVRFPNGETATLTYAGDNGYPYRKIADYLRDKGYMKKGFGNESVRAWLDKNPTKISEVMDYNPRFIFFSLKNETPITATGAEVIPWHTVAVDDQYIPLGSVLLAELPHLDANGKEIGASWQLLFAQDRGGNIRGQGRIDLYLGADSNAERTAHHITGLRKTFILNPKNG